MKIRKFLMNFITYPKILFMISFQNLVNILLLQNVFLVNIHRYEKILRQKLLSKCVKICEIIYTSSHPDYSFVVKSLGKYAKYQRSIHTMLYTLKL
ncbi:hypothetical protein Avbf_02667 [Armadillidium vulgare]|nr:hypothetical protein Avbf_02667 [Armadillidium vulgare]